MAAELVIEIAPVTVSVKAPVTVRVSLAPKVSVTSPVTVRVSVPPIVSVTLPVTVVDLSPPTVIVSLFLIEVVRSPAPDPMLVVVQSAEDRVVSEAVRRLKQVDREIVMLDVWEELSRSEIAEVMGMTRAAVDQRIHRAYQKLARALEPVLDAKPIVSPPVAEEGGT